MKEGDYEDVRNALIDTLNDIEEDQGGDVPRAWDLVYGADVHIPRFDGQVAGQFCVAHLLEGGFELAHAYDDIMTQEENDYRKWLAATKDSADPKETASELKKRKTEKEEEEN